ncbi:hypothetical protein [Pelagerythrobacter marinus]|uniref:hypothetical protein n=1 Tax=Pelagerythrobacter marinus TaxID=538382 RepID=UPI002AC8EF48|nr:hypothetical protein [Pelagerythrobacter marinus]WPZ05645.1 hypothetical protein T8T98_09405 [Pelagerythrobacter marinus]
MNAVATIEQDNAPASSTPIAWRSIEAVPDDRKDGRDVLLWVGSYPALCSWCGTWLDAVGRVVAGATHWADVEGPGL